MLKQEIVLALHTLHTLHSYESMEIFVQDPTDLDCLSLRIAMVGYIPYSEAKLLITTTFFEDDAIIYSREKRT